MVSPNVVSPNGVSPNEFHPDYASPPGDTLAETIEKIGMSQARRMGRPVKIINEIIQTKIAITAENALQLP